MPPRGKFSGRRGSVRGRGGKFGRGNGKRSYGGAQKFNNKRLEEVEESGSEMFDEAPPSDEYESEASISDVEETPATTQPYMALMQSLAKDSASSTAPSAKRRKLDHQPQKAEMPSATEKEEEKEELSADEEQDVDLVEEPEEEPANDVDLEDDDDDDDIPDATDPFETHFVNPDSAEYNSRLKGIQSNVHQLKQLESNGWRMFRSIPGQNSDQISQPPTILSSSSSLKLKHRLIETANKLRPTFDKLEQMMYPITFGYQDLLFCGRSASNSENLRQMVCLHAVNHVFKTRDRVIKNNAKLAREGENTDFEPRDQGFTRPKVLMILPTREAAVKAVNAICAVCDPDQQENRKRFDESYIDREVKFSADKPADFRDLFEGNDDDMFRIGIKFTRKTIKYFAQFYNSDILLASPLGLRMAIGSEEDKKKMDYDFLSSIEVVIVDHADALLNQNWEHVEHIFEHLNRQPREAHGCDFSRVREWYLDNQAENFRQTIVFSAFNTPELSELHRRGKNWAGRVRVQPEYNGVIQELGPVKAKQTFSRFEAPSIADEPDARFTYFTSAIIPSLLKLAGRKGSNSGADAGGTLIFIPSYLDFVRVRNYFSTSDTVESLSFCAISEYTDVREASRARSHFLSGRHKILLYTERSHHFRRYLIAGVRRVIMYGLPDNPIFYREIVGGFLAKSEQDMRLESGRGSVRVVFSKYDVLKLERVVGSKRVGKMIRERGDTFDFI
ncbi:hypothetical protein GQX73_g173 [Xylaria multiplex]|uniref:U3 small nucleolar RNA-associated protein 25 n=1 Tax=Xylaria multiplex TaxID=323545 RepID=A0A7C8J8S5_9PEZI|nr:hypothetical protein GQX73_g173 [Xylaria multiplex]